MVPDRDVLKLMTSINGNSVTRRETIKRGAAFGLGGSAAIAAALGGVTGPRHAQAQRLRGLLQDDPAAGTKGGTLRIATIGEPPTLDEHMTTAEITALISYCMFEGLFTYDSSYQPIPELAESHTLSADGLTHTIKLRQGIPFHNGETMTADDVIASLNRWGQISGVGKNLFAAMNELARVDDATIEFRMSQPYGTLLVALAHNTQACVIYPKSVVDAGSLEPLTEFVGTGPYKLAEWRPDAFARFERFDEYVGREEAVNGYGGKKYAYADVIEFVPVPDEAARVAGLQAGDYHYATDIGNDQYEVLRDAPGLVVEIRPPSNWDIYFLNWKSPMMSNLAMRQAVQAAMDMEPMLLSGWGGTEFIRLDPGLMMQESPWHTTAGGDLYNLHNPDLAKQKLQEAGYDGAPIRFLSTREYSSRYGESLMAKQQLEAIGVAVDLQIMDWATVLERRANPDEWDMFITGHGFVPDPSQITCIGQMGTYPGWWESEESLALADELLAESDFDARFALWEQVQAKFYAEVPAIKIGDASSASYRSDAIGGWMQQIERGVPFWNLWLND